MLAGIDGGGEILDPPRRHADPLECLAGLAVSQHPVEGVSRGCPVAAGKGGAAGLELGGNVWQGGHGDPGNLQSGPPPCPSRGRSAPGRIRLPPWGFSGLIRPRGDDTDHSNLQPGRRVLAGPCRRASGRGSASRRYGLRGRQPHSARHRHGARAHDGPGEGWADRGGRSRRSDAAGQGDGIDRRPGEVPDAGPGGHARPPLQLARPPALPRERRDDHPESGGLRGRRFDPRPPAAGGGGRAPRSRRSLPAATGSMAIHPSVP